MTAPSVAARLRDVLSDRDVKLLKELAAHFEEPMFDSRPRNYKWAKALRDLLSRLASSS